MKQFLVPGFGLVVALSACSIANAQTGASRAAECPAALPGETTVLAPFTDHYEMRVEKPADFVWAHLKRLYVDGERSRQYGYEVTPLRDDIRAYLGGTLAVQPAATSRPSVTTRVSAVDDKVRLLSLEIELENPVPVYVIHQVRPVGKKASVYQTIIQTKWPVTAEKGTCLTAEIVRERMKAEVSHHNQEVAEIMKREKAVIEARN